MASFDWESGLSGAQSGGSMGGPYGAIAGFVIGGFVGGHKKKMMKKALAKQQKMLRKLASPEHLAEVTKKLTPLYREQIAGGAGAEATSAIQNAVARQGLTGTGIGTALSAGGAAIPEIMAFKESLGKSQDVVDREISARLGQTPPTPTGYANEIGQIGDAVNLFKRLSAGQAGPAGGLTALAPGEFDRLESEQAQSATDQFANQPLDFSKFDFRR